MYRFRGPCLHPRGPDWQILHFSRSFRKRCSLQNWKTNVCFAFRHLSSSIWRNVEKIISLIFGSKCQDSRISITISLTDRIFLQHKTLCLSRISVESPAKKLYCSHIKYLLFFASWGKWRWGIKGLFIMCSMKRMKSDNLTEQWYLLLPQFNSFSARGTKAKYLGRK